MDTYIPHTRPRLARQSWYVTAGYVLAFEAAHALGWFSHGASFELAALLGAPAAAYFGLRSFDKRQAPAGAAPPSTPGGNP